MNKKQLTSSEVGNWGISILIVILCIAPVVLLGLLTAIIIKIIQEPICVTVGQTSCALDGWSLAGLAGTILGVGAAFLTILVGLAAIAWLVKLDQRIDQRVQEQVANR